MNKCTSGIWRINLSPGGSAFKFCSGRSIVGVDLDPDNPNGKNSMTVSAKNALELKHNHFVWVRNLDSGRFGGDESFHLGKIQCGPQRSENRSDRDEFYAHNIKMYWECKLYEVYSGVFLSHPEGLDALLEKDGPMSCIEDRKIVRLTEDAWKKRQDGL